MFPTDLESLPLDSVQIQVLRTLLRGEEVSGILRADYRLPSVEADIMNEALFDEIGDVVVICEDDRLSLVEDYAEELAQMLGPAEEE